MTLRRLMMAGGAAPWTPTNLTAAPIAWFNDDSPIIDAGAGACSQWDDLTTNGIDLAQTTPARQPLIVASGLNSRRTVRFNGSHVLDGGAPSQAMFQGRSAGWALVTYKKLATDAGVSKVLFFNYGAGGVARFAVFASAAGNANRPNLFVRRLDADSTAQLPAVTSNAANWQMALVAMDWSQGDGTIYLDGQQDAQNLSLTTSGTTSNTAASSPLQLGNNVGVTAGADVEIAEILFGRSTLPTSDEIDKLFGYAAHRWGLAGNLPIGHPYKSAAPTA